MVSLVVVPAVSQHVSGYSILYHLCVLRHIIENKYIFHLYVFNKDFYDAPVLAVFRKTFANYIIF